MGDLKRRLRNEKRGEDTLILELLELGEETGDVDDDAIADDGGAVGVDQSRGHHVEVVALIPNHNRVPGIIPSLFLVTGGNKLRS